MNEGNIINYEFGSFTKHQKLEVSAANTSVVIEPATNRQTRRDTLLFKTIGRYNA